MKDWPIPDSPVFSSQAKQKFGYVVIFQDTTESVNFAVQMYVPAAEQAEQEEYYRPIKLEERYDRFMEKARKRWRMSGRPPLSPARSRTWTSAPSRTAWAARRSALFPPAG